MAARYAPDAIFEDPVFRLRGEEIRHRRRCEEIIEFLNLEVVRKSRVADCSYGLQKRVELARAAARFGRLGTVALGGRRAGGPATGFGCTDGGFVVPVRVGVVGEAG